MIIPRRIPYFPPDIINNLINFAFLKEKDEEIKKLETDLEKKLGVPNPVVVSSGRIGLYLILKASNLKSGSEIIIPGYTFGVLKNFISKAGFKPVPVDADPNTFQMDVTAIKKAVTKQTSAILATHLFGNPCDIIKIKDIAKNHNLLLVEDVAESLGATVNGKLVGTYGDISLSSFNIAKPLQGITGGLIFGKNLKIIDKVKKLIQEMPNGEDVTTKEVIRGLVGYFISQTLIWPMLMYFFSYESIRKAFVKTYRSGENKKGISVRLPPYLAHITRLNLKDFKKRFEKRRKIKDLYVKYLGQVINFQKSYPKSLSTVYMIVAKLDANVLLLRRYLAIQGIDIAINDEIADNILPNKQSAISNFYNKLVAFPVYESLTEEDIRKISKAVKNFQTSSTNI
jgi:dTDP-4-amino-4,6-dideoxygalactose transaminase